jgi:hypothetical protein
MAAGNRARRPPIRNTTSMSIPANVAREYDGASTFTLESDVNRSAVIYIV